MYTYIMAHSKNQLFYVGVTNNIKQRTFDHNNYALKYNETEYAAIAHSHKEKHE